MPLTFCLAEDRAVEETGVRLAILSLLRYAPDAVILLYRPKPLPAFATWLEKYPQVTLLTEWPGKSGWNCKPQALMDVLDRGYNDVIWVDTDIIASGPFTSLVDPGDDQTLVVALDPAHSFPQGSEVRTKGWNFPVGRTFPITLNSCVLRVTKAHRPMLIRWNELLMDDSYVLAQKKPSHERPFYFMGDQDPLNALLGSTDFAHIPVKLLRRGRDVAHTGAARSYTLSERMAGLFHSMPPFFHTQWSKPWIVLNHSKAGLDAGLFRRVMLEASPYVALARSHRDELGSDTDTSWMDYSTAPGRLMRIMGLGHFALRGLPLTFIATVRDEVATLLNPRRKDS